MPTYSTPGVYVEEKSSGSKPIEGVSTSVAAFIGVAKKGPVGKATFISNFAEFVKIFGGPINLIKGSQEHYLYYAVRHFFTEGGTKCYVVRVMHYSDMEGGVKAGTAAFKEFAGIDIDGTSISSALTVSAINEGKWGEALEVQVENSSKYSLLLGEDITADPALKKISLKDNADVQIGDLLWIVKEVTGVVQSVTTAGAITFKSPLESGGTVYNGTIANGMKVFTPDFKLITSTSSAAVTVTDGLTTTAITLTSVSGIDGVTLKNGDFINFVVTEALVIVKKIGSKTLTTGEKVMVVEFEPQDFSGKSILKTNSRVYARGFNITVKQGDTILETHENLSLIQTNMKDYIGENRLSHESGDSFYIVAEKNESEDVVLPDNTAFGTLGSGDDGLTGLIDTDYIGSELVHTGLYALDKVKDASILVIPGSSATVTSEAIGYCERRQDIFFIIDPPGDSTIEEVRDYVVNLSSDYAALYYPWIKIKDPITGRPVTVPPSGAVAGIYADTDVKRGVHKAPAGIENGYVNAATGIEKVVTKGENDVLYQDRINVIRKLPEGIVVWGARTIFADPEWKYINVRRLFIFLEQSIERGTQWVVFEPNDTSLWKSIKRNITAFLKIQWMEGKLVGDTQEQAFYVKCDAETNPPEIVDAGQVITEIGVAPSKPAEFVVFRIRQYAGGSAGA